MALAPLQVAIPERLALAIPERRLVGDGTAAGHQIVVMAVVAAAATVATVAVAETIAALGAGVKILLRLR